MFFSFFLVYPIIESQTKHPLQVDHLLSVDPLLDTSNSINDVIFECMEQACPLLVS